MRPAPLLCAPGWCVRDRRPAHWAVVTGPRRSSAAQDLPWPAGAPPGHRCAAVPGLGPLRDRPHSHRPGTRCPVRGGLVLWQVIYQVLAVMPSSQTDLSTFHFLLPTLSESRNSDTSLKRLLLLSLLVVKDVFINLSSAALCRSFVYECGFHGPLFQRPVLLLL